MTLRRGLATQAAGAARCAGIAKLTHAEACEGNLPVIATCHAG